MGKTNPKIGLIVPIKGRFPLALPPVLIQESAVCYWWVCKVDDIHFRPMMLLWWACDRKLKILQFEINLKFCIQIHTNKWDERSILTRSKTRADWLSELNKYVDNIPANKVQQDRLECLQEISFEVAFFWRRWELAIIPFHVTPALFDQVQLRVELR